MDLVFGIVIAVIIVVVIIIAVVTLLKKKKEKNIIKEIVNPVEDAKTEMILEKRQGYDYERGTTVQLFNQPRKVKLTLTDINMQGKRYTAYMDKRIIIGRNSSKADICIDYDPFISGTHCAIEMRNGRFYLIDLQSSNKTFMNNNQVWSEVEISSGCIISMGRVSLHVEMSVV